MINKNSKGLRIRLKCIKQLKDIGYLVDTVEKTSRFALMKDLWGLIDLACIKPGNVLFVQVTCNKNHPHKKYQDFANKYGTSDIWIEQWVHIDYVGFEIWSYYPNNTKQKRRCSKL